MRMILGSLAVGLLVLYVVWKWKRAGQASTALSDAERAARDSFERLKQSPHFVHLKQYIDGKYRADVGAAVDPEAYETCYLVLFQGPTGKRILAGEGDAGATHLIAYLKRKASPSRIQVALDLSTRECTEAELGAFAWDAVVPQLMHLLT